MATEQHDKDYGDRTMYRAIILISALMLVGMCIIPNVAYGPKVSTAGRILTTIWVVILVVGGVWAGRVQRRYRCPKCGAQLRCFAPRRPRSISTDFTV